MSNELDNLVQYGHLKEEPATQDEFKGLVALGQKRLVDAENESLSPESRFDLAYNAAHSLALAALRRKGYRSENRYVVFQALAHTTSLDARYYRVLAQCHNERNLAEYQGRSEIDEFLLIDLIDSVKRLERIVVALDPPAT